MFKGKFFLQVPGLLKEGENTKGERQGHKLDEEHVGEEMPLQGRAMLGGGAARTGAAVSPRVPAPPRPQGGPREAMAWALLRGRRSPAHPPCPEHPPVGLTPWQGWSPLFEGFPVNWSETAPNWAGSRL